MQFLVGDRILEKIRSLVTNRRLQNRELKVAVAYWGKDSLSETGLTDKIDNAPDHIQIICDLSSGACNPSPISKLLSNKVLVKQFNGMHAKVWICGNNVIVGSANASANGLGFDTKRDRKVNEEAAVLVQDEKFTHTANKWFDALMNKSQDINPIDLQWANAQWRRRKTDQSNARKHPPESILDVVRNEEFAHLCKDLNILVWEESSIPMLKEATTIINDKYPDDDYWAATRGGWKYKKRITYIDFIYANRGGNPKLNIQKGPTFSGIFKPLRQNGHHIKVSEQDYIILREKMDDCNGLPLTKKNRKELIELIILYLENKNNLKTDAGGNLIDMPITDFVKRAEKLNWE